MGSFIEVLIGGILTNLRYYSGIFRQRKLELVVIEVNGDGKRFPLGDGKNP